MSKLLSEKERNQRISQYFQIHGQGITFNNLDQVENSVQNLKRFVSEQMIAHADMVIGEDVNAIERNSYGQVTKYDEKADFQNNLRAEQRERNR